MGCGCNKRKVYDRINISIDLVNDCVEAVAMLAMYTLKGVTLAGTEKQAMVNYVCSEVVSGNHSKKDYEIIMSLGGVNSLVDYIGGKVGIAVNAPGHSVNGYTFDGATNYINTNFNPSIDAVNYTLNDANMSFFIKSTVSDGVFMGSETSFNNRSTVIRLLATNISSSNNANTPSNFIVLNPTNNLLATSRIINTTNRVFKDGIIQGSMGSISTGVPIENVFIGGRNRAGALNSPVGATISTALMSSAIGFNDADNNTNLRALLTTLGALP